MQEASVLALVVGLSLENGCLHQKSFLRRNLFMSFALWCLHFPLYHCVSARAGWRSVCAINSPCRKKLFLSSFFFLSSAYTTSFFTKECWVLLFFTLNFQNTGLSMLCLALFCGYPFYLVTNLYYFKFKSCHVRGFCKHCVNNELSTCNSKLKESLWLCGRKLVYEYLEAGNTSAFFHPTA